MLDKWDDCDLGVQECEYDGATTARYERWHSVVTVVVVEMRVAMVVVVVERGVMTMTCSTN